MTVVLICCLVGPLWSYHSAQTKEYGEEVFTLTGRPVYYSFNKIQEYKSDPYGFNGAYRGEIIAAFLCVIFTIAAFALSVANLFLLGKTEYLLKLITSACFLVVMTAAMAIMILVGGQIHSLEKNWCLWLLSWTRTNYLLCIWFLSICNKYGSFDNKIRWLGIKDCSSR